MVYLDRIEVFEDVNVNKTSESKECNICHCWYFLIKGLSFNQMSAMDIMMRL